MTWSRSRLPVAFFLAASAVQAVHGQDAASVRLDPAVQVNAVDGDTSRAVLPLGPMSKRVLTLTAGTHVLDVCYDASSTSSAGTYVISTTIKCDVPKPLSVDARPGRLYRLKLELGSPWKTWIEDVTEEESALPVSQPKHKGEGKSLLLLRIAPANGRVGLASGSIDQIWFIPGLMGAMPMKGDGKNGFISRKIAGGGTAGIIVSWIPKNDSLLNTDSASPCGDWKIPVVDDAPGDAALYLGELDFTVAPGGGQVLELKRDGLEAAREYVKTVEPKLADKIQLAPFQWKRVAFPCPPSANGVLRNATTGITPGGAAAATK